MSTTKSKIIEEYQDAPLGEFLKQLIAAHDGVDPEDVTRDYIREQRQVRFFNNTGFSLPPRNRSGLNILSCEELKTIERDANQFLEKIVGSTK